MATLKRLALTYAILLTAFTLLIIAVFAIPTRLVRANVAESAVQVEEEGLWYKPMGFYLFQIDNMTDCLMMQINAYADSSKPVTAAMMAQNAKAYGAGDNRVYNNMAETTLAVAEKGAEAFPQKYTYARYWHGYDVVLRPLLCAFDYNQIRVLNYVCLSLLFAAVVFLLAKRLGNTYALTFAAAMIASNAMIVPMAMQFSTCFYIALGGMALFLLYPRMARDEGRAAVAFFTIGGLTSYMDFLTTPPLTLGLPLVTMLAVAGGGRKTLCAAKQCAAWLAGYASLWASKWVMAWLLTGYDIRTEVIENAARRVGGTIVFGGVEMPIGTFLGIVYDKITAVINPIFILAAALAVAAAAAAYLVSQRRRFKSDGWLLAIALVPLLWFAVMKNHSLQHIFFTWRDWILTLWCLMLFVSKTKDKRHEDRNTHTLLQ